MTNGYFVAAPGQPGILHEHRCQVQGCGAVWRCDVTASHCPVSGDYPWYCNDHADQWTPPTPQPMAWRG